MPCTRIMPSMGALPEFHSYYCKECGEAVTQAVESGEQRQALAEI